MKNIIYLMTVLFPIKIFANEIKDFHSKEKKRHPQKLYAVRPRGHFVFNSKIFI